jgi:hypothetical protein
MASLERATYEAFPSDFQKYNQKMRKLEFNIKVHMFYADLFFGAYFSWQYLFNANSYYYATK